MQTVQSHIGMLKLQQQCNLSKPSGYLNAWRNILLFCGCRKRKNKWFKNISATVFGHWLYGSVVFL